MDYIRNFCIIAHIDHGKSTLADRLLEETKTIGPRDMQAQILDNMDLERERGITIKSHAIQMTYHKDGNIYTLNLIDTPGHVDFSYEVSRSIAACEGAILVVDATQGIQAQTISNLYLALDHNLSIIPVINKIDLSSAMVEDVKDQIVDLSGCDTSEIICASAKTGIGIQEILDAIINRIPAPQGDVNAPLQAMIFDSLFNPYKGIEVYFRVYNGEIHNGDTVQFLNTEREYNISELGILRLQQEKCDIISAGNVGYIISGIKKATEVKVGDTITHIDRPCTSAIKGFEDVKPMVFAGLYPVDPNDYDKLKDALGKLQLNDASLVYTYETSVALGVGFRCGFLGMLHMDIVQERLEREFNVTVIITAPSVCFHALKQNNATINISSPAEFPENIEAIEEPMIQAHIITKSDYIGNIISLCIDRRGRIVGQNYLTKDRVELVFNMPLAEIVFDFFDKLKTVSHGYASLDYNISNYDYEVSDMVKVDILLNDNKVDALSMIVHRSKAYDMGRKLCSKLKELLPRQLFEVPIQAAIGNMVIARETVKAFRKDVIAKCYGGDITRKRKLLEKQKKGKKRMRQIGSVEVSQEAFLAILKV